MANGRPALPEGVEYVEEEPQRPALPEGVEYVSDEPTLGQRALDVRQKLESFGERAQTGLEEARKGPTFMGLPKAPTGGMPSFIDFALGLYKAATSDLPRVMDVAAGQRPLALPETPGAVEPGTPGAIGPETVAGAASLLLPVSPAAGMGAGTARVAGLGSPVAKPVSRTEAARTLAAETGVEMPRSVTSGPVLRSTAMATSRLPIGGGSLRKSAEAALTGLEEAGRAAAARPAGRAVEPLEAGGLIRASVFDATRMGGQLELTPRLRALVAQTDEGALGTIVNAAGSTNKGDWRTLLAARKSMSPEDWSIVESGAIRRMGMRGEEFDPGLFYRAYRGLSTPGKNILFRDRELTRHLDSIAEAAKQFEPDLKRLSAQGGALGTVGGFGALIATLFGLATAPMTTGAVVGGGKIISNWLSRPATAAPLAQFMRALVRVAHRPGAAAITSFNIAARNLRNTVGEDFDRLFNTELGGVNIQELPGIKRFPLTGYEEPPMGAEE